MRPKRELNLIGLNTLDPFYNLAAENYLFESHPADFILVYRNSASVIIGYSQVPWAECNIRHLSETKVPLLRRISGGGAVYHDEGNINFTLVSDRTLFNKDMLIRFLSGFLYSFGIDAEVTERCDILLSGRKISGSAFKFGSARVLHHCTLLNDTVLDSLTECLSPQVNIESCRGIRSVPSPVTTLHSNGFVLPSGEIQKKFLKWMKDSSGTNCLFSSAGIGIGNTENIVERYRSWEWIFGKSPRAVFRFDSAARKTSGWMLAVYKGRIESVTPFGTQSGQTDFSPLYGTELHKRALVSRLASAFPAAEGRDPQFAEFVGAVLKIAPE